MEYASLEDDVVVYDHTTDSPAAVFIPPRPPQSAAPRGASLKLHPAQALSVEVGSSPELQGQLAQGFAAMQSGTGPMQPGLSSGWQPPCPRVPRSSTTTAFPSFNEPCPCETGRMLNSAPWLTRSLNLPFWPCERLRNQHRPTAMCWSIWGSPSLRAAEPRKPWAS